MCMQERILCNTQPPAHADSAWTPRHRFLQVVASESLRDRPNLDHAPNTLCGLVMGVESPFSCLKKANITANIGSGDSRGYVRG